MKRDDYGWIKASEQLPPNGKKVEINIDRKGFEPFRIFGIHINAFEMPAGNFFSYDQHDEFVDQWTDIDKFGNEYVKQCWCECISTSNEFSYCIIEDDSYTVTHWRYITPCPQDIEINKHEK